MTGEASYFFSYMQQSILQMDKNVEGYIDTLEGQNVSEPRQRGFCKPKQLLF